MNTSINGAESSLVHILSGSGFANKNSLKVDTTVTAREDGCRNGKHTNVVWLLFLLAKTCGIL